MLHIVDLGVSETENQKYLIIHDQVFLQSSLLNTRVFQKIVHCRKFKISQGENVAASGQGEESTTENAATGMKMLINNQEL